jgi:hypothetical protein
VNALIAPIKPPETPRPISARPIDSVVKSCAKPKTSAPAPATEYRPASTRRGPKRSSSTPSGSWNAANASR